MFFVISGCFCYTKQRENETDDEYYQRKLDAAKKKIISILKYIVFGYSIYFTADIIIAIVTNQGFINIIEKVLQEGIFIRVLFYNHVSNSGGHMWFLLALFSISLTHYLIIEKHLEKIYMFLPFLIIVFLFFGVYIYLLLGKTATIDETRNALFLGLPCFAIGYDTNFLYKSYLVDKNKKLICLISFAGGGH